MLDAAEADFARLLRYYDRSFVVLKAAFAANPRDPYIATRLARVYQDRGEPQSAEECLRKALESNRSDRQLYFRYAEVLRSINPSDVEKLAYYFRRAFTPGDDNHEAQFWYARYAFESDDGEKSREANDIFRRLRNVRMGHDARIRIRDTISNGDSLPTRFTGTVSRTEIAHGFVVVDGRGDVVFFHKSNVDEAAWDDLGSGSRVGFNVGFTFGGPRALNVHLGREVSAEQRSTAR